MRWAEVFYGTVFFIASVVYAFVLNHLVNLSLVLNNFVQIFGISGLLMIGTVIITNTYIENLSHDYIQYVALTYVIVGILFLFFTKSSFLFTSICAVIAVYYFVKALKHAR
jgi:hypothetical protein